MLFEQLWDMQGKTAIFGRGGFNIRTFSHNGTIDKSRQKNGIPIRYSATKKRHSHGMGDPSHTKFFG